MNVLLVHITPDAEKLISYCARVSSPNQDNPNIAPLLKYCIKNCHWSVFEMASMCVEIHTSRAISQQIVRHKSFSVQEFSQRYSAVQKFEIYEARRQDLKNRQNSIADMDDETNEWFKNAQLDVQQLASQKYEEALSRNIAKEQARFLLPLSTETKLYMHGNIRSFIHYLEVRTDVSTQLEHRRIANDIKKIFVKELPIISSALDW
jgi:thymidylate synthase (FAD)